MKDTTKQIICTAVGLIISAVIIVQTNRADINALKVSVGELRADVRMIVDNRLSDTGLGHIPQDGPIMQNRLDTISCVSYKRE